MSESKTHSNKIHYEFGGPIGAIGIVLGLPIVVFGLYFICNENSCLTNPYTYDFNQAYTWINSLITLDYKLALFMSFSWIVFHLILELILPGEEVQGVKLTNGTKLTYIMSGHLQFWVTILAMGHGQPLFAEYPIGSGIYQILGFLPLNLSLIYDNYIQLIAITTIGAYLLSIYL